MKQVVKKDSLLFQRWIGYVFGMDAVERRRERESWPLAHQEKNKIRHPGPVHFLTEGLLSMPRGAEERRKGVYVSSS